MGFNITIDHATTANNSFRSGSSATDEEDSSGTGNTGVQVHSPTSAVGSHERDEYSDSVEEDSSWNHIYADDVIGPSDSASRPRTSNQHRPIVEAPERPQPRRRQSSRRQIIHERIPHHPHPRTRLPPAPATAPESVESYEEWPPQAPGHYVRSRPAQDGHVYYAPVSGTPQHGYAPSYSTAPAYSPYQTSGPPVGGQLVPFGSPAYGHNPYQNPAAAAAHGYFPPGPHGPSPMGNPMMPPHGASPYSSQELMHRTPNAGYFQYPQGYPIPPPMQQPMQQPMPQPVVQPVYVYSPQPTPAPAPAPAPAPTPAAATPAAQPTPPPPAESPKYQEQFDRLEKVLLDERAERAAREAAAAEAAAKAAAEKKIADDIAAASSAAAATATAEAEKKAEEAMAKAKEEADAAAAKAKEEAEAAAKAAADAAVPPPPPPPEEKKKPIKFKDAVGRKFSFPFHLCNTWMGMEDLIRQAFLHVEVIGPHVADGHYDLVGPQGDIILPQVWETVVEPDWTITMHMWPMPEPPPPEEPPVDVEGVVVVPDAPPADAGVPPPPPDAPSASEGAVVDPAGGKPAKKSVKKKGGGFWGEILAPRPKPKPKAKGGAKKPAAG